MQKAQRRSHRAGITFPVGRVHRKLTAGKYANRIGAGAAIFFAAALEYLVAEILELSSSVATGNRKKIITPKHIREAIQADKELAKLMADMFIESSGHPMFINKDARYSRQNKAEANRLKRKQEAIVAELGGNVASSVETDPNSDGSAPSFHSVEEAPEEDEIDMEEEEEEDDDDDDDDDDNDEDDDIDIPDDL